MSVDSYLYAAWYIVLSHTCNDRLHKKIENDSVYKSRITVPEGVY